MTKIISIDEIRKRKTSSDTSDLAAADSSSRPSPSSYVILLDEDAQPSSIGTAGAKCPCNRGHSNH